MRIVFFVHSVVSDWNNGNAHFQRGVARELIARGHDVVVYEPLDGWSRENLAHEPGSRAAVDEFHRSFPELRSIAYGRAFDLAVAVAHADLVIVHEWNDPALVRELGRLRTRGNFTLLFHDTHHRAVTVPHELARYDLRGYDAVLAFGTVIRDLYLERGWIRRAWTWHEAADTRLFRPLDREVTGDLVWIGNWGDEERTAELHEFLIEPARSLGLTGSVFGVRYPPDALRALRRTRLEYRGWLPNHWAPEVFARHRVTVHVPRRPYVDALPGVATIRPFEALACGIPLVSAPWRDTDHLFNTGDFRVARDGGEMERELTQALEAPRNVGLETIRARHTCSNRADELLAIATSLERAEIAA
jgi:spore maturation protein CgeB